MELNILILSLLTVLTLQFSLINSLDKKRVNELLNLRSIKHDQTPKINEFIPGNVVDSFSLYTLNGELDYPGPVINSSTPILFTLYNDKSAFMQCLLNSTSSVEKLLLHSPKNTHFIFLSTENAERNAIWIKSRFDQVAVDMSQTGKLERRFKVLSHFLEVMSRLHFVTLPIDELGNWIPAVIKELACSDHNCGLDQVLIKPDGEPPLVLPRLDARYDWLPSPSSAFGSASQKLVYIGTGCKDSEKLDANTTAMVSSGECSFFDKIRNMEKLGAKAVVIIAPPEGIQDMNCEGDQCLTQLSIPATMIADHPSLNKLKKGSVKFQNTASDNFFMALDHGGRLAEVGWFLYPSFYFHVWQAQWFDYMHNLQSHLSEEAHVVNIFNNTKMQGSPGAVAEVHLNMGELHKFTHLELHASLSCPGTRDVTCPHWDHTVQLFVSCHNSDEEAPQFELGRWISPFRRRIGQWITDVSPLIPLLGQGDCKFTMNTVPWAMTWTPSINLRFSQPITDMEALTPKQVALIYQGSFTFDKNYNTYFKPFAFEVPKSVKKALVMSVITGHGSDENQCGEFCNTTHTISINGREFTLVNNISGTPLGCALKVPEGVVPNEHGTWLYGRDGWCDGQPVKPWIIDITKNLKLQKDIDNSVLYFSSPNVLKYHGYFNGTDPDPKQTPGDMIVTMYLVYY